MLPGARPLRPKRWEQGREIRIAREARLTRRTDVAMRDMEAAHTNVGLRQPQGNDARLEDISPYEDLVQVTPPAEDFSALADVELGCFLRNITRFQALVQSHKEKIMEDVCPALEAVLAGPDVLLTPASALSLFEASRTARDAWEETSVEICRLFEHRSLPPFLERYCGEVHNATFKVRGLLGDAQKEEGAGWRKGVEEALVLCGVAARASKFEVDTYLRWLGSEGKRELSERRSIDCAPNI